MTPPQPAPTPRTRKLRQLPRPVAAFAIKAAINDPAAEAFAFPAHKTMYAGKTIAAGDRVFLFASETHGGTGLLARGIVTAVIPTPPTAAPRQTPRVSVTVCRDAIARRTCGRRELRPHRDGADARPEAELDFKLYRQATDKIVGLTDAAADWLERHF